MSPEIYIRRRFTPPKPKTESEFRCDFDGRGIDLFGTLLVNTFLGILTLGIYVPWGRVNVLRFFYSSTSLDGHRFRFTGTGKQMFIGYLKAGVVLVVLNVILGFGFQALGAPAIGSLLFTLIIMYLIEYARFSSRRFRFARTTYREIRFRLAGSGWKYARMAFGNLLLASLTLGLWLPKYQFKTFAYIYDRLQYGSLHFRYLGGEKEFFRLMWWRPYATFFTFGFYWFWWRAATLNYHFNHLRVENGRFIAEFDPGALAKLHVENFLILLFTMGLGQAWVKTRNAAFYVRAVRLEPEAGLDSAVQAAAKGAEATGEGLSSLLEIDADFGF